MAEAFVQVLLDNLSSLVQDGIGSYMGADDDIIKLSETLVTIQAVLEDAEDKQLKSKAIRNWLRKLNDLAYEIDDVLDECAIEASKLKNQNSIWYIRILQKVLNRFKIGSRVKEVTNKLDALTTESRQFGLQTWDKERQSKSAPLSRETDSLLKEPDLVCGRDEEMDTIIDILVNQVRDSQHLSVLPIIGIGGLGKTTLAQLVYNHPRVNEHFEKTVWVCVSDNFDIKTLVKAIIDSADGRPSASDNLDTLQRDLRKLLYQKKYMLILDDVWNEDIEEWAKLRSILSCGSSGASIVVTTRNKLVADIMGTHKAHELSTLSEEHCWSLFRHRAFGQEIEEHPNLEAIGREIVKKCSGVPLAAKALGSLLRFKRKEKEWNYVNESEIWNLPQEKCLILPSLRLSYQHLPLQLRQCFAYCAVYPKDYVMEKEEVIYCWMAHGYISTKIKDVEDVGIKDVEDVGNDVWNELVSSSLFQDVGKNYGVKTTFKMHDLVHDLAQSIMENKVPGAEVESNEWKTNENKIRQVNVRGRYVAFPRSFKNEVNISYTLENFPHLRVLDASRADVVDLPSEIDKLKHLRYLNLSNSWKLRTLPDTVCSLWNLQILNLSDCHRLVELPKRMRDMINLRAILLDGCNSLSEMPPKIGDLTSLKTLTFFIVGHKSGNQLDELKRLKLEGNLEIKHLERVKNHLDAKQANMGNKSNLRHLVLRWECENASKQQQEMDEKVLEALEPHPSIEHLEIYGFQGRRFPGLRGETWRVSSNLTKIYIKNVPNCSCLPPLGDLPRLKLLRLHKLDALEYVMENEIKGGDQDAILFPSLEVLNLSSLPNLKGLLKHEVQGGGGMPRLELLCLENLESLEYVMKDEVEGGGMPCLKSLYLKNLGSLEYVMKNEVEGGDDVNNAILFPSLEELELESLPNLKGVLKHGEEAGQIFPNLQRLSVKFSFKNNMIRTSFVKETLKYLSNLETLVLDGVIEHNLPIEEEEELQCLKSLTELEILNCYTLTCLPDVWLRHLTALETLSIEKCYDLVDLFPIEGVSYSSQLTHLSLCSLPNMVCMPQVLQHLIPSLQSLYLDGLPELTSLPDWLGNLTSLEYLSIHDCPSVKSLPASMKGMTNLERLSIEECPELAMRCEKEKGEDWHIIAHIPDLRIGKRN